MTISPDQDDFDPPQSVTPAKSQIDAAVIAVKELNEQIARVNAGFNIVGILPPTGVNAFAGMEGRVVYELAHAKADDVIIQVGKPADGIAHTNQILLRAGHRDSVDILGVVSTHINLARIMREDILPAIATHFPRATQVNLTGRNQGAFNHLVREVLLDATQVPHANGNILSFALPVAGVGAKAEATTQPVPAVV